MKLKDWADQAGVKYLTAYRWFKAGNLPVKAYQVGSGSIIVDDNLEPANNQNNNEAMSLFLKKTVEFSKNNSSIEDFAAFILSNFSLKTHTSSDIPKYSKNKPKTEDIQKHFQQFIPEKGSIDNLKMIKSLIKDGKNAQMSESEFIKMMNSENNDLEVLNKSLSTAFTTPTSTSVHLYDQTVEGVVSRNVELESTPQQFSYTGSTNITPLNNFSETNNQLYSSITLQDSDSPPEQETSKRKRGRKSTNKSGKNQ